MQTDNIRRFLETNATDAHLADLLIRARAKTLFFGSCSCLVGSVTQEHPPVGNGEYCLPRFEADNVGHLADARKLPFAEAAEHEFCALGWNGWKDNNDERCDLMVPILESIISQRTAPRVTAESPFADRVAWGIASDGLPFSTKDGEPTPARPITDAERLLPVVGAL